MAATGTPVVLVSAPAGYGKSTLLALWRDRNDRPVTLILVSAAVAAVLGQTNDSGTGAALRALRRHARSLVVSFLPAAVLVGLLAVTVVGLPVAVWLAVRYQFLAHVVVLEGTAGLPALRRSGGLVRHRWWHTAVIAALVWAGVHVAGVIVGLLLLIVTPQLPLWVLTIVVVVCQIVLVPLGAIMLALLYGDARAKHDERRAAPAREAEAVAA